MRVGCLWMQGFERAKNFPDYLSIFNALKQYRTPLTRGRRFNLNRFGKNGIRISYRLTDTFVECLADISDERMAKRGYF